MARTAQSAAVATKPAPEPVNQATNVMALLDVVGALSSGTLANSLYLFDNNRAAGSSGHGAASLSTVAIQGDVVVWTTMALECEAFARLQQVAIDTAYAAYVELGAGAFSETPEIYWFAKILKPLPADGVPYRLFYRLGSAEDLYPAPLESRLVPPPGPMAVVTAGKPQEQPLDPGKEDVQ